MGGGGHRFFTEWTEKQHYTENMFNNILGISIEIICSYQIVHSKNKRLCFFEIRSYLTHITKGAGQRNCFKNLSPKRIGVQ